MTFVFYDLETTGLDDPFDQIIQFAAIVTDDSLEVIDKVDYRCRLSPHVLPNPIALAVTGVSPSILTDKSLPSQFEFAQKIREYIGQWSPATWVGYNSLAFDENYLRQLFYQMLQPNIYETQFNNNNRFDVMLLVQACRARKPEVLNWTKNEKGKISFKLEILAPTNGYTEHDAHDALGDVEATIHLAKLIAKGAPDLWELALANRHKQGVIDRISKFEPIDLVSSYYGRLQKHTLCFCCLDGSYAAFLNILDQDPALIIDSSEEDLKDIVKNPKVIKMVAINKVPNLFPSAEDDVELSRRTDVIKNNPDFQSRLLGVVKKRFDEREVDEDLEVEEMIHEGFYTDSDKRLLNQFQIANWSERQKILSNISDLRLKRLGRRLVTFQSNLKPSDQEEAVAANYLKTKWSSEGAKWATFSSVENDLSKVRSKEMLPEEKIKELECFYANIRSMVEQGKVPRH
jgi:exodeoxyribonuclease-1